MDQHESELIRDGVRLSTQEIRQVLRTRQRTARRPGASPTLVGGLRMDFEQRVTVELLAPVGTTGRFLAAPLEISSKCLRILWSRFVHIGTSCLITLTTHDGEAVLLDGVVSRCDHFEGMLHETDITFERPVDPTMFVGMTESMAAQVNAQESAPSAPPADGAPASPDGEPAAAPEGGDAAGPDAALGADPDPDASLPHPALDQQPAPTPDAEGAPAPAGDADPGQGEGQGEGQDGGRSGGQAGGEGGDAVRPTSDTMVLAGELFDKLREGMDAESVRQLLRQIDDSMAS